MTDDTDLDAVVTELEQAGLLTVETKSDGQVGDTLTAAVNRSRTSRSTACWTPPNQTTRTGKARVVRALP